MAIWEVEIQIGNLTFIKPIDKSINLICYLEKQVGRQNTLVGNFT
jgi:hypothetical protein